MIAAPELKSEHHILLVEKFKAFYEDVQHPQLEMIGELYAPSVRFKDPVHELQGIEFVHAYLMEMSANVEYGRFEYLDQLVDEDKAYIKWNMYFRHPKLGNEIHEVRGMTQIQFTDRIYFHEDVYDMGQLIYEHIPVMGTFVKMLKKRLVSTK
ncbi:nuclear transport factor 2 family protein [Marinomonas balearica]|uniref:SnoaL-like protein n=1 Tax=Marinomonas balearica TaxID=491947 RepID=A0A4R6M703_9GAMM|nr:nuclear transport factor 2 family protein [Marinomonas balearica]TDO95849.1 SnoaL-like protein [Marinomonas balearica]